MAAREHGPSRAKTRARLLGAAARVRVPARADVCVVGGGAAGLVAAISAAEAGAKVVVLEREATCGQTILATGNGRCNFANAALDPGHYNDPAFVRAVAGHTWLPDVLSFFERCGLAWEEESEGRLYPLSRQASSVRNVLLARADACGVTLAPARDVQEILPTSGPGHGFSVRFGEAFGDGSHGIMHASRVVVATGGGARACASLGLPLSPPEPVLCPLACEGTPLGELDGRRVRANALLSRDGRIVWHEGGEVLFRTYGLSGIVVFNLSRHARPGDSLVLDLLPDLSIDAARRLGRTTLDGILDPVVAIALKAHAGSTEAALTLAKALPYKVLGPTDARRAQVTRGGLVGSAFAPATLECKKLPGLFACGEALDVDGPCGGFNLAWAWKSGMVAGKAAGASARAATRRKATHD